MSGVGVEKWAEEKCAAYGSLFRKTWQTMGSSWNVGEAEGRSEEAALGMADRDPGRSPGTASPVVLESSGCPRAVEQAAGCPGRHRAQSPGRRGKEVLDAASDLAHTQE